MTNAMDYLRSLQSVRDKTGLLLEYPEHLQHFKLNLDKLDQTADMIISLIERDYSTIDEIPPHSRWRHFEASRKPGVHTIDRIGSLTKKMDGDELERVRQLLDLFLVGVLLDAGAGSQWTYTPVGEDAVYNRSEGLAVAAYDWFCAGGLSSTSYKFQADSTGLKSVTVEKLAKAFQMSESNPLVGLEGRTSLLQRLGDAVETNTEFFPCPAGKMARPGYMLDYLIQHASTTNDGKNGYIVDITVLWKVVMDGLSSVWPPARTKLDGVSLGDVWPCKAMEQIAKAGKVPASHVFSDSDANLVSFHKLSQWLTYSLMEPLSLANITFKNVDYMTGLAEYRNGGLFVDMGVLEMKSPGEPGVIPKFQVYDDIIVEWRALTVGLLDKIASLVRTKLKRTPESLPLAKVLEAGTMSNAGTWKAGREVAAKLRPATKGPPIDIVSDGTVF